MPFRSSFSRYTILLPACLIIASVICQAQLPAGPSPQTLKADDVLAGAKKLYSAEGPARALPEYEKALALFRQENNRKGEAITIGLMGNAYKRLGQLDKALEYLQRALTMKRELGDRLEEGKTLNNIGLFYWNTSNYPKAIEFYNLASVIAKELGDRNLEAALHNNVGLVYDDLGDYRRSLEAYNQALEIYRGSEPSEALSNTIGNIGGKHLLLGEYAEALRYYEQALAIDERLKLKPAISVDLENIGLSLIGLGRIQEAIQNLDRGVNLAHESGLKREEADCRRAKASALLQLSKYTEALEQYAEARQVYEQLGANAEPEFKQQLVEVLGDLGNLEIKLGDAASAEKNFRRALEISEAIKHPRGITVNLISLGDLELRQKRFAEAGALYSQALARATEVNDRATMASAHIQLSHTYRYLKRVDDASREAQQAQQIAQAIQARPLEAEAVYARAEVLRSLDQHDDALKAFSEGAAIVSNTSNPEMSWRFDFGRGQSLESVGRNDEALAAYQSAAKTIEAVRSELREERFRAGFIEDKYQVYVALVQLFLKLGRAEEAFLAAEKLRARSYLDLLGRGQPPIRNEIQRSKETNLQRRIRELQKNLEDESVKPIPDQRRLLVENYSKQLQDAEREYEVFLDDLSKSDPDYAAVRALKIPSGDEVRQLLPAATALIEYVIGEQDLVIFLITNEGLRAKSVPIASAQLQSKVETLRDLMLRNTTNEWKLPAASLYKTLIAPVEDEGWLKDVKRLYIIPHAILHYVPFALLCRGNGNRVLVDDYVLAYLPAAAALGHVEKSVEASNSVLAMAPSSTRLRYTEVESKSVSGFFPKQHTLLLGTHATESSFKRLSGGFDVIHLATHGYFNKANPLLSGLMLEADASDDGRLEVHEILGMNLKATLVTLSACDTALGSGYFSEVPQGDDLVGLTRAFLSTGTPSVMATLWEVNDRSAVRFMDNFYGRLKQTDKATALADAQRAMRSSVAYRHPYYWAAFVLVGQMK